MNPTALRTRTNSAPGKMPYAASSRRPSCCVWKSWLPVCCLFCASALIWFIASRRLFRSAN